MTLEEIFEADGDAAIPLDFPELIVDVPEQMLRSTGHDLNEGRWTPSSVKGIYQRIDPARAEMKQRRHVHLAAKKHLKATGNQVSWNDDGSRHDRHKCNAILGLRGDYRDAARAALKLGDDVFLEQLTDGNKAGALRVSLHESLVDAADHERVFLKVA